MRTVCKYAIAPAVLISLPLFLTGCGKKLPAVVEAGGVVRINGKPLKKASVTFVPLLDQFGTESNSFAVTDDDGRYQLTCRYNGKPGAVVGQHIVLVEEAPLSEEMHKVQNGAVIDKYRTGLGNRPIPPVYAKMTESPLRVEVKPGQTEYDLDLKRAETREQR